MKSNSRGIIALLLVSVILLVSDLQNRNVKKSIFHPVHQVRSEAIAGKNYILGLCYFAPEPSHDELLAGLWAR